MLLLFLHAYSLGGGTYTGIEAVSNGLPIMREPRVETARRTMAYMAASLALTAGGLVLCYLLWRVHSVPGKTLNAVLAERVADTLSLGHVFVVLTLIAEGALLVVAAQAGFLDGPRVLANMANDGWAPRRFSMLSERLTTQNGIVLMGGAALAALLYTRGEVRQIVVMYSINVFLTFSLSMLGMAKWLLAERRAGRPWRGPFALFAIGFAFCVTILAVTVFEKFGEGGWVTLLVTGAVVTLCLWVRRHYQAMQVRLGALYESLANLTRVAKAAPSPPDPSKPTAAVLVGGYSGLGIHTMLAALRTFPGHFRNVVFLAVGVVDSAALKDEETLEGMRRSTEDALRRYKALAEGQGLPAACRMAVGTDVVSELERLCLETARDFDKVVFFAGQVVFRTERWYQPFLHNRTAFAVQKRLQWAGHTMVILPARL
jgi:hypothetical protein